MAKSKVDPYIVVGTLGSLRRMASELPSLSRRWCPDLVSLEPQFSELALMSPNIRKLSEPPETSVILKRWPGDT